MYEAILKYYTIICFNHYQLGKSRRKVWWTDEKILYKDSFYFIMKYVKFEYKISNSNKFKSKFSQRKPACMNCKSYVTVGTQCYIQNATKYEH